MSAAAVLAIVVAASEARTPSTVAMLATAEAALPPGTSLRLLAVADPAAIDAGRIERQLGAGAVVALVWQPAPDGPRASLRVHVAGPDRWTTRVLAFRPEDSASERGRTLGFAIASMWPEIGRPSLADGARSPPGTADGVLGQGGAPAADPQRAAVPARPAGTPADGAAAVPPPTASEKSNAAPAAVAEESPRRSPSPLSTPPAQPAPLPSLGRFALGLGAVGTTGIGGAALGAGGWGEVVWRPQESWVLRAALALRTGPVPGLPGTDGVAVAAAGGEWWPRALVLSRRLRFGARADLLWIAHWVRRIPAPGEETDGMPAVAETLARMLPGTAGSLRASLRLGDSIEVVGGVGVEIAFGRTELQVGAGRMTRATIPPAHLGADIGLRISF